MERGLLERVASCQARHRLPAAGAVAGPAAGAVALGRERHTAAAGRIARTTAMAGIVTGAIGLAIGFGSIALFIAAFLNG